MAYFLKLSRLNQGLQLIVGQPLHNLRSLFELQQFIAANVGAIAFGIAENKNCTASLAVKNNGAIAARLSRTATTNALFDDTLTQRSVNQSMLRPTYSSTEYICSQSLLARKAREPSTYQDFQRTRSSSV
jgi:hypothetical protein